MNRDDILRMAKEAGMALGFTQGIAVMNHKNLEHFANLVAASAKAEEREAWANNTTLKLIADWKYMVGIAERGFGTPLPEGMAGTEYLLSYVKELEAQANLVAAAEREAECHCGLMARVNELEEALLRERDRKLEEGWRQCAVGQGTTQFCAVTEEAVKAEREACLSILRDMEGKKWHTVIHGGEMKGVSLHDAYMAIRAKGLK